RGWPDFRSQGLRATTRADDIPRRGKRLGRSGKERSMSMYYIRMALKSFRSTPGLTALMVCAIALGIAVCVMTMTVYHAMSGNPIWWKNDRLYAVTMDNWDPDPTHSYDPRFPNLPPPQMTYKDAMYLLGSKIPERKSVTFEMQSV